MSNAPGTPPFSQAWGLPLTSLGMVLGVALARQSDAWLPAAIALALCLLAALLLPGRRLFAVILAATSLGALVTCCANALPLPAEGEYALTGVVLEEIRLEGTDSDRLRTTLGSVTLNGEPLTGKAFWTAYLKPEQTLPAWLRPGAHVMFTAQVYHPQSAGNPGGYDFRASLRQNGITIGVYGMEGLEQSPWLPGLTGTLASIRHGLSLALMDVMGEESGSLAAAMLLGTQDFMREEDQAAFRTLGISHILSVSGYHVGVLAILLDRLAKRISLARPLRLTLLSVLLALYATLTGASPPVIRAGLLLILREIGHLRQHRNLPLHLLALSAILQLLYNPLQLFGASFQLTYSAILGLILIYPRLRVALTFRQTWLNWIWNGLAASLAVQLGLLPAQLYWFSGFPLASAVVNVFVIGLTSIVMTLYWLTLALLPVPFVRDVLGALMGLLTRWLLAGIRALAGIAGYSIWTPAANLLTVLGWAMLLVGLSFLVQRHRIRLRRVLTTVGALLIAASLIRLPNDSVTWLQFSDGEADAALLHDEDAVVLVDAGENEYTVSRYLLSRRLPVDALILTHLHADHGGGIAGLISSGIPVRRCYLPEGAELAADADPIVVELLAQLEATGTEIIRLARGDVLTTPNARFTVLWPQSGAIRTGQPANDVCLVLQADVMGTSLLLTGDVSSRYEMYSAVPADILKVAHHGSPDSTSPAYLGVVRPQAILLSCGTPAREEALRQRTGSIPVYSTNASGAITIRFSEDAFTMETHLPR